MVFALTQLKQKRRRKRDASSLESQYCQLAHALCMVAHDKPTFSAFLDLVQCFICVLKHFAVFIAFFAATATDADGQVAQGIPL